MSDQDQTQTKPLEEQGPSNLLPEYSDVDLTAHSAGVAAGKAKSTDPSVPLTEESQQIQDEARAFSEEKEKVNPMQSSYEDTDHDLLNKEKAEEKFKGKSKAQIQTEIDRLDEQIQSRVLSANGQMDAEARKQKLYELLEAGK